MRKQIIYFLTAFALGSWHMPASAALKFGTSEKIQFITNITIQGTEE